MRITPSGCCPGILYNQAEIHKLVVSKSQCFRAILDANDELYHICWLNSLLQANFQSAKLQFGLAKLQFYQLTTNGFTVKDSFTLVKKIIKSNYNYVMGS